MISPPVLISVLLSCLLCFSACSRRLIDYNYKITVEVETPEGLVSGYAVRNVEIRWHSSYNLPEARGAQRRFVGEAVAIDLPNGETLFSLMSDNSKTVDQLLLPRSEKPEQKNRVENFGKQLENMAANKSTVFEVSPLNSNIANAGRPAIPQFVRFANISDPKSIELVDPDDLAATFGDGYGLKRITIQITDEPVTFGISRRFSWWEQYQDLQLDGQRYNNSNKIANRLNTLAFSQGK
jgi:hypothetical protein